MTQSKSENAPCPDGDIQADLAEFFERADVLAQAFKDFDGEKASSGDDESNKLLADFLVNPPTIERWRSAFPGEQMGARMRNKLFRELYIRYQGFCILTSELIEALGAVLEGQRVLEVGCGQGTLAQALKSRFPQLSLVAVDKFPEDNRYGFAPSLDLVVQADAVQYLTEHCESFDTVLMVWPPYNRPFAHQIAKAMRPGMQLVHCHEGSTGDQAFRQYVGEEFSVHSAPTAALNQVQQNFWLIHDCWQVCTKD